MRLLVASAPKTGNVWLENLLSAAFGLRWVREAPAIDYWNDQGPGGLRDFLAQGRFPTHSVCHQHFWPSRELFTITSESGVALATTLRHPYDQFVSWYWYIQRFPAAFVQARDPAAIAIGKAIDAPEVLTLLATRFGRFVDQSAAWLESGRSLVVRYEDLHHRPEDVVDRAAAWLGEAPAIPVHDAIEHSSADRMRQRSCDLRLHVRSARVGDWREHLSQRHLAVFRAHHRQRIERIGYCLE